MTAQTDHLLDSSEHHAADQLFIDEEQSANSDDTVFLDLPLPPVPHQAVHVHNVDADSRRAGGSIIVSRVYSRMDDFDEAPRLSPESCTLSVGSSNVSDWSSSDEDTSFYRDRERLSQFRCSESFVSTEAPNGEGGGGSQMLIIGTRKKQSPLYSKRTLNVHLNVDGYAKIYQI